MASVSQSGFSSIVREMFSVELYKPTQGRRVRQFTAAGIGVLLAWGLLVMVNQLEAAGRPVWFSQSVPYIWFVYGVPLVVGGLLAWAVFRIVNWPRFADFLIATEAEMTKVSWPKRDELVRATVVVLVTLFFLAGFLLAVDMAWSWLLERIGVLEVKPPDPAPAAAPRASLGGQPVPAAWNPAQPALG